MLLCVCVRDVEGAGGGTAFGAEQSKAPKDCWAAANPKHPDPSEARETPKFLLLFILLLQGTTEISVNQINEKIFSFIYISILPIKLYSGINSIRRQKPAYHRSYGYLGKPKVFKFDGHIGESRYFISKKF